MTQSKSRVVSISSRTPKRATPTKLFVLDTNVLMHDPTSLYRLKNMTSSCPSALEELDNHKKGHAGSQPQRARASRFLDGLVGAFENGIAEGIPLNKASQGAATGRLFPQTEPISVQLPSSFAPGKADNEIIAVCLHLQKAAKAPHRAGVERHQHAHQGTRPGTSTPRTISTTRCWRTAISSTPA